jgi:hypothetical protein
MATIIRDSWWFTDSYGRTVGIVKTENTKTKEIKFRIGNGLGFDQNGDIAMITQIGSRFYPEQIK